MASDPGFAPRFVRSLLTWAIASCAIVLLSGPLHAGPRDPIEGEDFRSLVAGQDLALQKLLRRYLTETGGYHVLGPIDPVWEGDQRASSLFSVVRVLCDDPALLEALPMHFGDGDTGVPSRADEAIPLPRGFRGQIFTIEVDGAARRFVALTAQQTRWLIWRRDAGRAAKPRQFDIYAEAVSAYLGGIDRGLDPGEPPDAQSFDLPASLSLFPPRPDYVIEGYANYKSFLYGNEEVRTDFARGIVAFIPTDSLLDVWKATAPKVAYPNKEEPLIQYEFKKFFERGGNYGVIRTLTAEVLRDLEAGEYFFAVGMSGRIRFGFEMPREEVDRIEAETGRKLPRANHAYLFPGEAVLTAGAFFVEREDGARIVAVNAQSGHYFYSNVTPTVREDIAVHSNDYLMTLGHFFRALDEAGIPYDRILVSKL